MDKNENKLTPISELGEFGLIELLTKKVELTQPSTKLGIKDDAAIMNYGGEDTVVSTDLLVEGVHFDLAYVPLKHLGYKAVSVNASDIYAMNARPQQITVSIALSNRFPVEAVEELYEGIDLACKHYGIDLVGGDTSSSRSGLMISVTVIGSAPSEKIVRRGTAKPNDLICVSGDLGGAYAGLQLLEREKMIFKETGTQPTLDGWDYIIARQLKPEARKDIFEFLEEKRVVPTSMIDISDGLSSELLHISKQSGAGVKVFEEKVPVDAMTEKMAEELNLDATTFAMNGGEDYELLFTIDQKDYETVAEYAGISVIGHVMESEESCVIARDGTPVELVAQGWNHAE